MIIETIYYSEDGWAAPLPREHDSEMTLVLCFGGPLYFERTEPFRDLRAAFPRAVIIGCSSAGEIIGQALNYNCVTGAVVRFTDTRIESAVAQVTDIQDSFSAGERIAAELYKPDLQGILVLSGGMIVNGSDLVKGINSALPAAVPVSGGLAGDNGKFERTWALNGGTPCQNCVSAVGFYGDKVKIRHGSKGGWDIFGPERKVTKATRNTLFELDGKPALQLYKNYLGDRAAELPASALLFPLGLRARDDEGKRVVRTILSVNEEEQSLTFAGDIFEGGMAQLMRANFDRLIDGATEAALMTGQPPNEKGDILSVAISCIGRRLILGERAEEELETVLDVLPEGTKQVGFYSYGEISPFDRGYCDLHNQTMTLTVISED